MRLFVLLFAIVLASCEEAADFATGDKAFERGDYTTALKHFEPLAEQGNAWAQYALGVMRDNGNGLSQDYSAALKWYVRAAEQGHGDAQRNLAAMYLSGHGVKKDYVKAYMWLDIADDAGAEGATLGRIFTAKHMTPADIKKAEELANNCTANNYKGC